MRVFGPLKADAQALPMHAIGDDVLMEVLQDQLQHALERERLIIERAQEREARLLALLENEQQARRDLEQKLLPTPLMPTPASNTRLILLVILLLVALAWNFRAVILSALAP